MNWAESPDIIGRKLEVTRADGHRVWSDGCCFGKGHRGCTKRDGTDPNPDLVNRAFDPEQPDRLWVTDITEHPTAAGKLYCAVAIDAWSRRLVGWSIATTTRWTTWTHRASTTSPQRRCSPDYQKVASENVHTYAGYSVRVGDVRTI